MSPVSMRPVVLERRLQPLSPGARARVRNVSGSGVGCWRVPRVGWQGFDRLPQVSIDAERIIKCSPTCSITRSSSRNPAAV